MLGFVLLMLMSEHRWCGPWLEFMRRFWNGSGRRLPAEILKSSRAPSRKRLLRFSKVAPSTLSDADVRRVFRSVESEDAVALDALLAFVEA